MGERYGNGRKSREQNNLERPGPRDTSCFCRARWQITTLAKYVRNSIPVLFFSCFPVSTHIPITTILILLKPSWLPPSLLQLPCLYHKIKRTCSRLLVSWWKKWKDLMFNEFHSSAWTSEVHSLIIRTAEYGHFLPKCSQTVDTQSPHLRFKCLFFLHYLGYCRTHYHN